jgi:Icc protein
MVHLVQVRLAHVSDTHLVRDKDGLVWGHNPAANLASVMAALPAVDAIVLTGDVAEDGTAEAYGLADSLTYRAGTARYVLPGNHDDAGQMSRVFGAIEDVRAVTLSDHWSIVLLNTQWIGHETGLVSEGALSVLDEILRRLESYAVLCAHHPPISPCTAPDCGLRDAERLLRVIEKSPVRAVISGHVHQVFGVRQDGIDFFGAPSTLCQLRHGGTPHYHDTDDPPAAQILELLDDGRLTRHLVSAR